MGCFRVLACAVVLIVGASLAHAGELEGIDDFVTEAMELLAIPGVGLTVVRGDEVVLAKGYGTRTVGQVEPVDEHTLFAIASTAKPFTSTALGMLVEEGLIDWEDPLIEHMPEFRVEDPYVSRKLTIRDALSHRSGLLEADLVWLANPDLSRAEIMRRIHHLPLEVGFRPITMHYNNLMYLAAGEIISRVTDLSWDQFMTLRLLEPLGMSRSNTTITAFGDDPNVATPHEEDVAGATIAVPHRKLDNSAPAGAINSTAADMAAWCRLQLGKGEIDGRRLVAEEIIIATYSPHTFVPLAAFAEFQLGQVHASYGLGWLRTDYRKEATAVLHTGGIDGMSSAVALLPEHEVCVVVLTNKEPAHLFEVVAANWVFDRVLDLEPIDWLEVLLTQRTGYAEFRAATEQELVQARTADTTPSVPLAAYAGTYVSPLFGNLVVELEDEALRFELGTDFGSALEHWNFDTYRVHAVDLRRWTNLLRFALDERGVPTTLTVSAEAGAMVFQRAP